MYFFAMDLGWNRVPILLILLIFWKHAVGHKGWISQDFHPQRKGPVHKVLSPRGAQSSVLEAPVTGSIPFEEVASNVLAGKSLNANRSRFSLSHQYVKGGVSSSESMSLTQSAPSASVSASMVLPQNQHGSDSITSLLQLQGSLSPSVQDIANQTGHQLVETSSPLSAQSSSSAGSSANSLSKFTYTSRGSSRPQKAGSSSQLVSTHGVSGLLLQSLPSSTASQNIPGSSAYTKLAASPLGVSQSTSGQSSYSQYTSASQSRAGTQLAASRQYVPTSFQPEVATSQYASKFSLGAKVPVSSQYYPATQSGSSLSQGLQASGASQSISQSHGRLFSLSSAPTLQLQGTSSQYAPAALYSKVPVYSQAAPSGSSLSLSQPSQLKPSSWSRGFQTSGTVTSQSSSQAQGSKAPSRLSTQYSPAYEKYGSSFIDSSSQATSDQRSLDLHASTSQSRAGTQLAGSSHVPTQTGSTFTDGSSLQLQGTSSQYTPAALVAKVPVYNWTPSRSSSFLSQPSQLKPSTSSWFQGFQASGTATSQSSSSSQGSKAPSRLSTLTSVSPGQFASTQEISGRYSGLSSQSQSASSQYRPGFPAYAKHGSSLQLQGTSSQYTPAALVAKVPVYSRAPPGGSSFSLSQPSQLKPSTSRWSQGFQASGTVTSQSSSSSQGSKAPSRFSTLTSAASPGQFASTQTGSTFTEGSSLPLQGTSSQYTPAALVAKVPVYNRTPPGGSSLSLSQPSQLKPSTSRWSQGFQAPGTVASQGFQTFGTATSQSSSSSQGSKAPSRFSTVTSAVSPGQFASTQESGRYSGLSSQSQSASSQYRPGSPAYVKHGSSLPLQGTSSQYTPAALVAKVPVYNRTPSTFSSFLSQPSQLKPSSWFQGFQASGTATQSSSSSQGSKAPSRFSTITSAVSPGQFASTQESGRYSGLSSRSQSASSQYSPGSPAYAKYGSSFIDATSDQSSFDLHASTSQSRAGTQLAGSSHSVPKQTGNAFTDGSFLQLQGTSSQAAPSGYSSSQPSQWQPSTSRLSQGFQVSGPVASQSSSLSQGFKAPSRFSTLTSASPGQLASTWTGSTFTEGSSLPLQGTSSQYAPAALVAKVPVYNRTPSRYSSSLSQPSQLKPSSWSQGFQASGTATSQSSSSSQGSKAPSRFSTLTSASAGQFASTQESGKYSGLSSQSQRATSQYRPGSPAYAKHGSSLQLQGTSSQYTPAALVAKVPVYSWAPPGGSSSSLSQPSQLKPSSWSQGFQASGTATSQSSSSSQGSKAPSRFSTLTSAASPGQFASTQERSGRYSGLSSQSQSASSQYRPGSPAYIKYGSSLLDVSSQSTSDQSAFESYVSSSQSGTDTQLADSSHVPTQTGSTFTDGSSFQLQGTSSLYAPAVVAKVPVYSWATPSGSLLPSASRWSQGFQASGTAVSQSSSSPQTPQFSSASVMPALSPPVDSVAQSSQSFSSVIRRQMSPGRFASVQHPTDSVTSSLGSNVQAASQGMFSGQSSDSTSVVSSRYASTYDQKPLSYSRPSQSSSSSGRYSSSVKG